MAIVVIGTNRILQFVLVGLGSCTCARSCGAVTKLSCARHDETGGAKLFSVRRCEPKPGNAHTPCTDALAPELYEANQST